MFEHLPNDALAQTLRSLAYETGHIACFRLSEALEFEWSAEACAMLALSPDAAPRTWFEFEQRFLGAPLAAQRSDVLLSVASVAGLHMSVTAEGRERRIFVRTRPLRAGGREMAGILCDLSNGEQREAELLQAGELRERLQQLGRWSLLGEMASGLAHELNQPLAAMSTFAQAGERMLKLPQPKVEKAATLFREISEQALRAGDSIHRMRGLVKRQGSESQRLAVAQVLTDFRSLADPIARAHQVAFAVEMPAGEWHIEIDPSHIQQVLMSLFRNALDALRETSADLRAVQVRAQRAGESVELVIADTGPGIPDTVARELFRPFFSTKPEGTGLGLAVCRSIVGEYGGSLRFANGNPGAAFVVALPLAQ